MKNKATTTSAIPQHLIAGLIPGSGIEFFGLPETKEVKWLQNGHVRDFSELPLAAFITLLNALRKQPGAKKVLKKLSGNTARQVELFTYFCYGGLDNCPDMVNGELKEFENYRHSRDCISLEFKPLKINGRRLKSREIKMIDLFVDDTKDEFVALDLGITRSTLNQHKRGLFQKAGVFNKPGLMIAAFKQQLNAAIR